MVFTFKLPPDSNHCLPLPLINCGPNHHHFKPELLPQPPNKLLVHLVPVLCVEHTQRKANALKMAYRAFLLFPCPL